MEALKADLNGQIASLREEYEAKVEDLEGRLQTALGTTEKRKKLINRSNPSLLSVERKNSLKIFFSFIRLSKLGK